MKIDKLPQVKCVKCGYREVSCRTYEARYSSMDIYPHMYTFSYLTLTWHLIEAHNTVTPIHQELLASSRILWFINYYLIIQWNGIVHNFDFFCMYS